MRSSGTVRWPTISRLVNADTAIEMIGSADDRGDRAGRVLARPGVERSRMAQNCEVMDRHDHRHTRAHRSALGRAVKQLDSVGLGAARELRIPAHVTHELCRFGHSGSRILDEIELGISAEPLEQRPYVPRRARPGQLQGRDVDPHAKRTHRAESVRRVRGSPRARSSHTPLRKACPRAEGLHRRFPGRLRAHAASPRRTRRRRPGRQRDRRLPARLVDGRMLGRHHRRARGHALDDWQPKALEARRVGERRGRAIEGGKLIVRDVADPVHAVGLELELLAHPLAPAITRRTSGARSRSSPKAAISSRRPCAARGSRRQGCNGGSIEPRRALRRVARIGPRGRQRRSGRCPSGVSTMSSAVYSEIATIMSQSCCAASYLRECIVRVASVVQAGKCSGTRS